MSAFVKETTLSEYSTVQNISENSQKNNNDNAPGTLFQGSEEICKIGELLRPEGPGALKVMYLASLLMIRYRTWQGY